MFAVRLADKPASWAGLRRVRRIHQHDRVPGLESLVLDHLPQLEKRPGNLHVSSAFAYPLRRFPDALEIFEYDERGLFAFVYECLGDLMVHVSHPTVFSVADAFEPASGAAGSPLLQSGAQRLVVRAFVCHLLPRVECGLVAAVVAGGEESHAQVDAHDVLRTLGVREFDGAGDEQHPLASLFQQACGAEPSMPVLFGHALPVDLEFDAPFQGVDAQPAVGQDRIVTVPHEIVTGGRVLQRPLRLPWVSEAFLDGPVVADHADDGRLGHLRADMVGFAQMPVGKVVEFPLGERPVRLRDAAHMVAAGEVCRAGAV